MGFADHVRARLSRLERAGTLRQPRVLDGPTGPVVSIDGRRVIHLCANDYLGLANHPTLRTAAQHAMTTHGTGTGASRHVSGTARIHRRAESALAAWVHHPAARLFSSGYATNVGVLQSLAGPGDVIFSDALNHASLIDGCRLSRARVVVFPHRDYDRLEALLARERHRAGAALVVTDAVFSMDGHLADLPRLRALSDLFDAALVVDEAHALGLMGPRGAGLCAAQGVRADVLTGMLGKACGAMGGFVAADADAIRLIENGARSFIFSTAPPASQAAVAEAAASLVPAAEPRRRRLRAAIARLRQGLVALGYPLASATSDPAPDPRVPILPVHLGHPALAMDISSRLLAAGVYVHGIRPPSVKPGTSRLRVTVTADHTDGDLDRALQAFARVRPHLPGGLRSPDPALTRGVPS